MRQADRRRARTSSLPAGFTLAALIVLAVVVSALLGWVIFVLQAPIPALGAVLAVTVGGVTLVRPVFGLYTLLLGVSVVEQYSFNPAFHPLTAKVPLYDYVFGRNVQVTPLDLLLGLVVLAVIIDGLRAPRGAARAGDVQRRGFVFGLVILALALVFSEFRGAARAHCQFFSPVGGLQQGCNYRFKVTIYELRAFVYAGATALLAYRLIDTPARVRVVARIFTVGVTIKACQTLYRLFLGVSHGYTDDILRAPTAHEDALFFALFLIMAAVAFAYRGRGVLERQFLAVAPLVTAAFVIANRRAAYVGLVLALACILALLPSAPRRRLLVVLLPLSLAFAVYAPLFWNKGGTLARPARAVHAVISPSGVDQSSNQYRVWEAYDLRVTLKPVLALGVGLGHTYQQPIPLPKLDSEYQPYIAHQELLWFWVATGTVGFVALWTFFGGLFVTAASAVRRHGDPALTAVAAMAVAAVALQITASAVDLQLTFFRNMTILGFLAGVAARMHEMPATPPVQPVPPSITPVESVAPEEYTHV